MLAKSPATARPAFLLVTLAKECFPQAVAWRDVSAWCLEDKGRKVLCRDPPPHPTTTLCSGRTGVTQEEIECSFQPFSRDGSLCEGPSRYYFRTTLLMAAGERLLREITGRIVTPQGCSRYCQRPGPVRPIPAEAVGSAELLFDSQCIKATARMEYELYSMLPAYHVSEVYLSRTRISPPPPFRTPGPEIKYAKYDDSALPRHETGKLTLYSERAREWWGGVSGKGELDKEL